MPSQDVATGGGRRRISAGAPRVDESQAACNVENAIAR